MPWGKVTDLYKCLHRYIDLAVLNLLQQRVYNRLACFATKRLRQCWAYVRRSMSYVDLDLHDIVREIYVL